MSFDSVSQVAFLRDLIACSYTSFFPEDVIILLNKHFGYHNVAFFAPERPLKTLLSSVAEAVPSDNEKSFFIKEKMLAIIDTKQGSNPSKIIKAYNNYNFAFDYMAYFKLAEKLNLKNCTVLQGSATQLTGNEYINRIFTRDQLQDFLCLYLVSSDQTYLGRIAFAKYPEENGFTEEEIQCLSSLAPDIARQFEKYLQHNSHISYLTMMNYSFSHSNNGIIYLNKDYEVLFANPRAKELCKDIIADTPSRTYPDGKDVIDQVVQYYASQNTPFTQQTLEEIATNSGVYTLQLQSLVLKPFSDSSEFLYMFRIHYQQFSAQHTNEARDLAIIQKYHLTRREAEILKLLQQGCSTKEIASKLVVSPYTVKTHVNNILQKTGAKNRNALNSLSADDDL